MDSVTLAQLLSTMMLLIMKISSLEMKFMFCPMLSLKVDQNTKCISYVRVTVLQFLYSVSTSLKDLFIYVLINEEEQFYDPPLALKGLKPDPTWYNNDTNRFQYVKVSPIQTFNGRLAGLRVATASSLQLKVKHVKT